jgi:hypothetical protein
MLRDQKLSPPAGCILAWEAAPGVMLGLAGAMPGFAGTAVVVVGAVALGEVV